MKKINFDKEWFFHLETETDPFSRFGLTKCEEATNFAARVMEYPAWQKIDLPHDWGLELEFDLACDTATGGKRINRLTDVNMDHFGKTPGKSYPIGWYRKEFFLPKDLAGKRIYICFDGICRDSIVWVNGAYIDRHASAYTPMKYDITDYTHIGESKTVAVQVENTQAEGWWYDGAGIYRHAWLMTAEIVHSAAEDIFVDARVDGTIAVTAKIYNDSATEQVCSINGEILSPEGKTVGAATYSKTLEPWSNSAAILVFHIDNPQLWDLDSPQLYQLIFKVNGDTEKVCFGIRSAVFDPNRGFLLNGRPVKIKGACVHQDFAGVGTALPDSVHYHKIARLKEMGGNAYRSAHHPPASELLDACDRLGMMVMDETRMFGSGPEAMRQLQTLICRDRNHPSVILWSIGNEEMPVHNTEKAADMARAMMRVIRALDNTRAITYGGNNTDHFEGVNGVVDVRGVNYIHNCSEDFLDQYHADHPHQPIVATEEASALMTRGCYQTDLSKGIMDSYGDNTMPWGSTQKGWWKYNVARDYLSGSFLWTGFDYRGEPSPFNDINISSCFGVMDTCGFAKDDFYYYRAWWQEEPVLHILPNWNHTLGEKVRVVVYSNCSEVELFLNGTSLGKKQMCPNDSLEWEVSFEPGTLSAVGVKGGKEYRCERKTAGKEYAVVLKSLPVTGPDDGVRLVCAKVVDRDGNLCPNAAADLSFEISGGEIIGVGNGDAHSQEWDKFLPEQETREIGSKVDETNGKGCKPYAIPWRMIPHEVNLSFADDYRNVWTNYHDGAEQTMETEYTCMFDSDGEYVEFPNIVNESEIYLNGVLIATVTKPQAYRPYRFYCQPVKGENTIVVKSRAVNMSPVGYFGSVLAGRTRAAKWHRKAYHGLALVIVKKISVSAELSAVASGIETGKLIIS